MNLKLLIVVLMVMQAFQLLFLVLVAAGFDKAWAVSNEYLAKIEAHVRKPTL
jgi:hypothetical protein